MPQTNPHARVTSTRTDGPHFVLPASKNEPTELRSLQSDIEHIVSTSTTKLEAIQAFLQIARCLTNASDVAYALRHGAELKAVAVGNDSALFDTAERQELLLNWSAEACQSGEVQLHQIDGMQETVATLPVFVNGQASEAVHAALLVPRQQIEPFIVSLQLIATGITAWYARYAAKSNHLEAHVSSALIELIAKCNEADSLHQAHYVVVTELQKLVGCDSVAFATRRNGRGQRFRVTAISATAEVDQNSNVIRHLTECATETDIRETTTVWPPLSVSDRHSSLVHQKFIQNHPYEAIISLPVETEEHQQGVLFFLGKQETLHQDTTINLTDAIAPHIASALLLRKEAEAGPFTRVKRSIRGNPEKRKSRRAIFLALALGGLAMMIPIPHRISCDCTVEPTLKRFATVPFDGILQQSLVKPGDIVQANQVLAKMDDRDLRFERAESTAARTQTLKEVDVHLSKGNIADAQIARFKSAELQAKLDLIQYRENHLEIKTLIDGVVIEGDLEDAEGASVRRGEVLFEVAPLDSLKIKLSIPEEDIAYVKDEMTVTARLDGAPGKKFEASLDKIKPRASAETGENVFTADANLDEMDQTLRPGMSGTAKVVGPARPIGWIVFHRAYRKVVDIIDW